MKNKKEIPSNYFQTLAHTASQLMQDSGSEFFYLLNEIMLL